MPLLKNIERTLHTRTHTHIHTHKHTHTHTGGVMVHWIKEAVDNL